MNSTKQISAKKKPTKSTFRKVNDWLHLWLGLTSGIIVLVVCLTGCIWVFHEEITGLLEPETKIEWQNKPVLTPTQLAQIGSKVEPNKVPSYANYQQGRTIELYLRNAESKDRRSGNTVLKVNPYSGEIISTTVHQKGETDFFRFILNGHRFLWMPPAIGRPIVNYGTLIFVLLLITGLIWWYPKKWNKSTRDKSFKIKWGASFKRVNLDLHNVLGFYSLLFLAAIALTGMVYGIKWYSEGLYWVTSGGEKLIEYKKLESDSLQKGKHYSPLQAMDLAWFAVIRQHPKSMGFYYSFPDTANAKAVIDISVYPNKGQFYNRASYSFDQHTLKEIKRLDAYSVPYEQASASQKLRKMNYDIHVGSILGLPGKILAFLVTLIGASLPITGFLVWYGRKFKKQKAKEGKQALLTKPNVPAKNISSKEEELVLASDTITNNKLNNNEKIQSSSNDIGFMPD